MVLGGKGGSDDKLEDDELEDEEPREIAGPSGALALEGRNHSLNSFVVIPLQRGQFTTVSEHNPGISRMADLRISGCTLWQFQYHVFGDPNPVHSRQSWTTRVVSRVLMRSSVRK